MTDHPGAALHVAGAGASYAVKSLAQDGAEIVHHGLEAVVEKVERLTSSLKGGTAGEPSGKTAPVEDDETK
ncbi:hypothetical protein [Terrihabitans rhizophilus]|uniref:Uncharacterized protein n=1 Tax=Terrihabitans rhizophilus TaxID=3092662 RepID=A0ABU4RNB5_9HYPH|nr:hypothetical protein [Terrihabitans sp. PJ23]MDX6805683.1 hypothetical protein [Terrihabitans sp. PJ23]